MSEQTAIQWTDATWNPVTGCTKVSPGCANCYIERTPPFRMAGRRFVKGAIPVLLHHVLLGEPLRWRKPRRVFVCSLADLFHEDVPDEFIDRVFSTMMRANHHTFQVLTKRPDRMRAWAKSRCSWLEGLAAALGRPGKASVACNIWLGVSVENQRMADERIPLLLETPAAVRFLSCEPLLGPLDLGQWLVTPDWMHRGYAQRLAWVDWVIVGGESGPGRAERKLVEPCSGGWCCPDCGQPVEIAGICRSCGFRCPGCDGTGWRPKPQALEWVRDIRGQCQAAGVPLFVKQWGGPRPTSGGRALDGRTWDEMPR